MSKALRLSEDQYKALIKRNPGYARLVRDGIRDQTTTVSTQNPHRKPYGSQLEERLVQQLNEAGLIDYVREYYPILGRELRLDVAWPPRKLYVEVQGMTHRIKGKFRADIEKRALLTLAGWRGLEVGGAEIKSGKAIEWIKQLLA